MAKKLTVAIPVVGGVYRIPLRRVFNRNRMHGDATWDKVYGKAKCSVCRKPLNEGDPYTVSNDGRKFQHVTCEQK